MSPAALNHVLAQTTAANVAAAAVTLAGAVAKSSATSATASAKVAADAQSTVKALIPVTATAKAGKTAPSASNALLLAVLVDSVRAAAGRTVISSKAAYNAAVAVRDAATPATLDAAATAVTLTSRASTTAATVATKVNALDSAATAFRTTPSAATATAVATAAEKTTASATTAATAATAAATATATTAATAASAAIGAATGAAPAAEADGSKGFAPFRLWIGTNLDLLDGIGVNKLYAQLSYSALFGKGSVIMGGDPKDNKARWLLSGTIFQNKTLRSDSLSGNTKGTEILGRKLLYPNRPPVNDSVYVVQTNYKATTITEVKRLGGSVVLGHRLVSWGDKAVKIDDLDGEIGTVNLFLAGRADFYQRQATFTTSYDTLPGTRAVSRVPKNEANLRSFSNRSSVNVSTVYHWAIGFPFWVITNKVEFRLNPFVGFQNTGPNNGVFMADFNITEKELGLSIGGDYLAPFGTGKPEFGLYISKAFTLKDFRDAVKFN